MAQPGNASPNPGGRAQRTILVVDDTPDNLSLMSALLKDKYRVTDDGGWINVEGDKTKLATGSDLPCNIENCYVGELVGKFVTDSGVESIFPIGAEATYTAPENGTLYYQINDTVWYDNKYFKSSTIEDRTAITVEPGE